MNSHLTILPESSSTDLTTAQVLAAYPGLAAPITLTSTTTDYLAGSWVEIVPASTITANFTLVGVYMSTASNTSPEFVVQIGTGAAASETVIASVRWRPGNTTEGILVMLPVPIDIAANTRVAGRLATSGTTARTIVSAIQYQERPL